MVLVNNTWLCAAEFSLDSLASFYDWSCLRSQISMCWIMHTYKVLLFNVLVSKRCRMQKSMIALMEFQWVRGRSCFSQGCIEGWRDFTHLFFKSLSILGGFAESDALFFRNTLITFTQLNIHSWNPSTATVWCVCHWAALLEQSGLRALLQGTSVVLMRVYRV